VGLTEAGQQFLSRAKPAFEEIIAASALARDLGQRPSGLLRLAVPRAVVPILLEPLIASFCRAYPEIEVEIAANEKLVDLADGGFDAGMRMGQFIAADMVAVRVSPEFPMIVVGSPAYFAAHEFPERPEDLDGHACIRWRRSSGALALWSFRAGDRTIELAVSGPFIANDFPTLLGAAIEGQGLAQLPAPVAAAALKAGQLVSVLDAFGPSAGAGSHTARGSLRGASPRGVLNSALTLDCSSGKRAADPAVHEHAEDRGRQRADDHHRRGEAPLDAAAAGREEERGPDRHRHGVVGGHHQPEQELVPGGDEAEDQRRHQRRTNDGPDHPHHDRPGRGAIDPRCFVELDR